MLFHSYLVVMEPSGCHSLHVLSMEVQLIHSAIRFGTVQFYFSACYGMNNYIHIRDLWQSIVTKATSSLPWVLAGNFNTIGWTHEKIGGASPRPSGLIEFNDCIQEVGLIDLKLSGSPFTWVKYCFLVFQTIPPFS